jgi:DNA-binding MarR family transcriptional regulator
MTEANLQQNLYWLLISVSMRTKHELMKVADAHGLTPMQLFTLCSLTPEKGALMGSLSQLLLCDASNVTGIVDRLLVSGYVTRSECENDRRSKHIALTPKGAKLREELIQHFIDIEPVSLANLTATQKKTLTELLIKASAPKI